MREVLADLRALPWWEKVLCVAAAIEAIGVVWFLLAIAPQ